MEKPSFFKVLIGDFEDKLQLPPEFVKNFFNGLPRECVIRSRIGTWHVKITGSSERLFFNVGWKVFVEDHSLELGDFLTFEYHRNTEFHVKVFGKTACEKDFAMDRRKKNRTQQRKNDEVQKISYRNGVGEAKSTLNNISQVKEETGDDFWIESLMAGPASKKRQGENTMLSPSSSSCKQYKRKTRNQVGNANGVAGFVPSSFHIDKQKVIGDHRKGTAYKSKNSSFELTMTLPYIGFDDCKAYIPIPAWFAQTHLSRKHEGVMLLVSDGKVSKRWNVNYSWKSSHLNGGWLKFVRGNFLEVGDICVFEAVKEELNTLKVAIRRHRGDADPYVYVD
ncbi:B3 domain-containing protein Os01g0723500-like isoform X2 [Tripterygium wilfordii]|uniref:B3 domain-containing protein Os01g0723500-like isoform X2 n=1 Tax=Tripterygium wilfordii TaxID=458696 RepID=UPI0018F83798|nr:B3 domain-containing protein Os01g0723500-like isoform X2 [Tripterygium wilfordii]